MYVVLAKDQVFHSNELNVRFKLKLLATPMFSRTFTCVRKQHNCEKNEAQVQQDAPIDAKLSADTRST